MTRVEKFNKMDSKNYHYVLRGTVKKDGEIFYLEIPDKTQFKIKQLPANYPSEESSWLTTLNMTSDGKIISINLEEISDEVTESAMTMTGRVTVLGRKMSFAQLKVSRPPLKTLRISVHPAHKDMKTGQTWSVTAVRQGDILVTKQCKIMEKDRKE
ncbi:hypothetical protein CY0110_01625 [Crocosphaera chwakensis CCY0110]|uniref:Uncharacterized protein n=2 Tax=Crocosphaera TaxID=263510 RepID=A3IVM7_9CHRO|nr:hypothetical protein CY0110_01625 [Crocosphaera chwakensis CCY0110]